VPVFLYGALAGGRTRAELRRGGVAGLQSRIAAGELRPDFGPSRMHPGAGATLVAARPPLVAFNVQLAAPATVAGARRIASLIREGGAEGLPGLRAIGLELGGGVAQVSMNIERPFELTLATVVSAVRRHAEVANAELVGLAPRAALQDFPDEVQFVGLNPEKQVIENILAA
jgi:glutamate formiminotransferase